MIGRTLLRDCPEFATPESREEEFANVKIDTDGEVASVSFDYVFLANGIKSNWGKELWQLV